MSKLAKLVKQIDAEFITFRFTDTRGKWQQVSFVPSEVDADVLKKGIMFDGSSIAGWKSIDQSDMVLMPDLESAVEDIFAARPTVVVFCDVYDPITHKPYERDPRSIAKAAEKYLKSTGIGDTALFGPELEFFVFDDVRYAVEMNHMSYSVDGDEGPYNTNRVREFGNHGHQPKVKGGYFPVQPVDGAYDLRAEMVVNLNRMGADGTKHHHEVATSQHELGFTFDTLTRMADKTQIYKYVIHNTAHGYGKTATFLPKPMKGDNGSGMHVHQSIRGKKKNVFAGNKYANLSQEALYYIGGLIRHGKALNAFTNASTNSYKRLVPGYEAPVILGYSYRNRSVACRIPHVESENARRIEARFPDGTCNPYLGFAAMLMAGLDGIKNKISPGEALDYDLYALSKEDSLKLPNVCGSLREALEALDKDRAFLKQGGVFSDDMINAYIDLKMQEVEEYDQTPHPVEFKLYYSV